MTILGTIISDVVDVKSVGGQRLMQAFSGDKVETTSEDRISVSNWSITKLTRNGRLFNLSYPVFIAAGSIHRDAPPIDPPPVDPPPVLNDYVIHMVNDVEVGRYYRANP